MHKTLIVFTLVQAEVTLAVLFFEICNKCIAF